jgi:hypothetical protein
VHTSRVDTTLIRGRTTAFYPVIHYAFTVDGQEYDSGHILISKFPPSFDEATAQNWVVRYPVGARVIVSYDPGNPTVCLVDRHQDAAQRETWGNIGVGVFLGFAGLAFLWLGVAQFLKGTPAAPGGSAINSPTG